MLAGSHCLLQGLAVAGKAEGGQRSVSSLTAASSACPLLLMLAVCWWFGVLFLQLLMIVLCFLQRQNLSSWALNI